MIIRQKEDLDSELKQRLKRYVYDIIGVIQAVHNELPQGMPEYLYQEALTIAMEDECMKPIKEYVHHPEFRGRQMKSFIRMDLMIPPYAYVVSHITDAARQTTHTHKVF